MNTLSELKQIANDLQKRIAELEKQGEVREKEYPKEGTIGFFMNALGSAFSDDFDDSSKEYFDHCNWFITQEEVYNEKMRRQARARRWLPVVGDRCYTYLKKIGAEDDAFVDDREWRGNVYDWALYHAGLVHKTKQEAMEHWEVYGKHFMSK